MSNPTIVQSKQTPILPDIALQALGMPPVCASNYPTFGTQVQTSNQYPSGSTWYPSTSYNNPTLLSLTAPTTRYITTMTDSDFGTQQQIQGNITGFINALLSNAPVNWITGAISALGGISSGITITQQAFSYDSSGTAKLVTPSGTIGNEGDFNAYVYDNNCKDHSFDFGTALLFTLTTMYNPFYKFSPLSNYYKTSNNVAAASPDQTLFNMSYPVTNNLWLYHNIDWNPSITSTVTNVTGLDTQTHSNIGKVAVRTDVTPTVVSGVATFIDSYVPLSFVGVTDIDTQVGTSSSNKGNYWLFFSPYYPGLVCIGNLDFSSNPSMPPPYPQYSPYNILNSTIAPPSSQGTNGDAFDSGNGYRCLYFISPISTATNKFITEYDALALNYVQTNYPSGPPTPPIYLKNIPDLTNQLASIGVTMQSASILHCIYAFVYMTRARIIISGGSLVATGGSILCKYTFPTGFATSALLGGLTIAEPVAQSSFYIGLTPGELNSLFIQKVNGVFTPNGFIENMSFVIVGGKTTSSTNTSTSTISLVNIIGLSSSQFNSYVSGGGGTPSTKSYTLYIIIGIIAAVIVIGVIAFFVISSSSRSKRRFREEREERERHIHREHDRFAERQRLAAWEAYNATNTPPVIEETTVV
jgi:uncharacterized membrane protein